MTTVFKTRFVKTGNFRAIRIPKLLLDQTDFDEEVELEVREGRIMIRAVHSVRAGWEEQFRIMAEQDDDDLLDEALLTTSWDAGLFSSENIAFNISCDRLIDSE